MLVYCHPTLSKTVGLVGREKKLFLPGCPTPFYSKWINKKSICVSKGEKKF